jgi:hypothetical protein
MPAGIKLLLMAAIGLAPAGAVNTTGSTSAAAAIAMERHSAPSHASPASVHHAGFGDRNPHLHGFHVERHETSTASGRHVIVDEHRHVFENHVLHERWWKHHWYYTADAGEYVTWYRQHTGTGAIEGTVVGADNSAVANVKVNLRKPHGRIFLKRSLKHLTHTDAYGNFRMLGVRPGSYRLIASTAVGGAHVQIHVDSGVIERAELQVPISSSR